MSAEETLQQIMELIPSSNRRDVLLLLEPHLSPEMLAVVVSYIDRFNTPVMGSNEVVEVVFSLVAELTGTDDFRQSKSREVRYAFPRQLAMFVIYNEIPEYSYRNCAELFSHKFDHATAIHACKSMENRYTTDKTTRQRIDLLITLLTNRGLYGTRDRVASLNVYGKIRE